MIESTVQTVINIIAGAVISYLFALYRAKKKENNALKAGLQALLRDRMLIYGKEATTQIENSVPYYSVSKWSSNTKMLLLHFHAP